MDNQTTVIGADVEITGKIQSKQNIQLNGKLEGDLSCNQSATIGRGAQIKGNLACKSVTVAGRVDGNITAEDRIEMQSGARVMGDIKAKRLAVEDGVTFVGGSEVNPDGLAK